jgi:hypothetical protein
MDKGKGPSLVLRDSCSRPTPAYNSNYNPYAIPNEDTPGGYSPYVYKEPLFDDRPVVINELPKNCILAPPPKRPRTSWVWPLGYAITDSSRSRNPILMWHCKLCKYSGFCVFIINLEQATIILNLGKERSISSLRIPSKTSNNIYENAIISTKEEIYGDFVTKEVEYKHLVLLMEATNV